LLVVNCAIFGLNALLPTLLTFKPVVITRHVLSFTLNSRVLDTVHISKTSKSLISTESMDKQRTLWTEW